jgi:hypothetical protein
VGGRVAQSTHIDKDLNFNDPPNVIDQAKIALYLVVVTIFTNILPKMAALARILIVDGYTAVKRHVSFNIKRLECECPRVFEKPYRFVKFYCK